MFKRITTVVAVALVAASLLAAGPAFSDASDPTAPTNVVATAGQAQATVSWTAPVDATGVTGYEVISTPGAVTADWTPGTPLSVGVGPLTNMTSYTFVVRAFHEDGSTVDSAASAAVTPQPATAPPAPTDVKAFPGQGQALVTWVPAGDGGAPITSWRVVGTPGGSATVLGANATSAEVLGLANGTAYTFTVYAINSVVANGKAPLVSAPSNKVTPAAATLPYPPTDVSATSGDGQLTVSWINPTSDGGSPIDSPSNPDGYTVAVSPADAAPVAADGSGPVVVGGLTNGKQYQVTVSATNSQGTTRSEPVSATPYTVPGAPTGVTGTAGDTAAVVSWTAPADDGGSPVTGYTVRAYAGPILVRTAKVLGVSTTITGLTDDTAYTFTVTAANAAGDGPASAPSAAVTPTAGASAPSGPSTTTVTPGASPSGYWVLRSDGSVYAFGSARWYGNAPTSSAVALAATPSGQGYLVLDSSGKVFPFGDAAKGLGDPDPAHLVAGEKAVSLTVTPSGNGYWIFTDRGRAIPAGAATFFGDMSATTLNGPVVGAVATPSGRGYWMVGSDGGIFTFGDATFLGSMGGRKLNGPVTGLVPVAGGAGYRLVATDGGVFSFGEAPFLGSMGGHALNAPVIGMVGFGDGYLMVASDGGVFDFSSLPFNGSLGGTASPHPVVSLAALAG